VRFRAFFDSGLIERINGGFIDGSVAVGAEGDGVHVAEEELAVEAFAVESADSAGVAGIAIVVEFPEIVPEIEFGFGDFGISTAIDFGDSAGLVDGEAGIGGLISAVDADEEHDALPAEGIAGFDELILEFHDLRVEVGFVAVDGELFGGKLRAIAGIFDEEESGFELAGDGFLIGDEDAGDAAIGFEAGANLLKNLILLLELLDLPLGGVVIVVEKETEGAAHDEEGQEEGFGECANHSVNSYYRSKAGLERELFYGV
jgi:hypothetical protein